MLPYLERFAPTQDHNSGFQMPLVFDDCGITLEGFVCLLSAVLRSLGSSRGGSFSLLPSGGKGLFCPKNNLQKAPKLNHLLFYLVVFLIFLFCFVEE